MRKFFGYVRVSTAKQGEHGVSLQEQRDAITRFAERTGLTISAWFEERETAAKRGRRVFNEMLKQLRQGKAVGVIIHKIDRSARNLRDWADLGELIDRGIEVQFANESLDLQTRGGRLSADIQAVVAADYIRNLREETRKGFYGRIKQGLFPLAAPLGYIDRGKGKPKELDPAKAPLVRKAFELYASGIFNLPDLSDEMFRLGLRNRRGNKVSLNGWSVILNNPFYIGLIRIKRTKETFPGAHQPLIPKSLFDRVQQVLNGKVYARVVKHEYLFRRLITCRGCEYSLIGERQKGHVYYRCHTKGCQPTCLREESIDKAFLEKFSLLEFLEEEKIYVDRKIDWLKHNWVLEEQSLVRALELQLSKINDRLARLTDAYLDGTIDKEIFDERKTSLLMERKGIEGKLVEVKESRLSIPEQVEKYLELAGSASLQYKLGFSEEKRDLVKVVTSNRYVEAKTLDLTLSFPFQEIANRSQNSKCGPDRDIPRTLDRLIEKLVVHFKTNPAPVLQEPLALRQGKG